MTDARDLTQALGGRWHGSYGTARCPAHEDRSPSLSIRDGEAGRVLVHCFAGCAARDVLDALRSRGLLDGEAIGAARPASERPARRGDTRTGELARALWAQARPARGSLVETYLAARGMPVPAPPSLRFAAVLRHGPTRRLLPAMVGGVQDARGRVVAVHRTFLSEDGSGKANVEPNKMMLGPCAGGAVRFGRAGPDMGVGEGIESTLSVQFATGLPCWAALSTSGLRRIELPEIVRRVIILADGDPAGIAAARDLAARLAREGRAAQIAVPGDGEAMETEARRAEAKLAPPVDAAGAS